VENVNGSDLTESSDDTLTLLNDVTGVSVNLANGSNTLNPAAGANALVDVSTSGTSSPQRKIADRRTSGRVLPQLLDLSLVIFHGSLDAVSS
jgi:hypothetical protein